MIAIQSGSIPKWLLTRFSIYSHLVLSTILFFIFGVLAINDGGALVFADAGYLSLLATGYVLFFAAIFFSILLYSSGRSANALNIIGIWLLLCVIIPGSVHQYASLKHPVAIGQTIRRESKGNLCNLFVTPEELIKRLLVIYPTITERKLVKRQSQKKRRYADQWGY